MSSHSDLYFQTLSLHFCINGSTPYSSICGLPSRPSIFSTSSSTGRPWVSQPALRTISYPFITLYLNMMSLTLLVITWPICGLPLAVGGPSYHVNLGPPDLNSVLFLKISFFFQKSSIAFSLDTKSRFVDTLLYISFPPKIINILKT